MNMKYWTRRGIIYLLGLFIMALGVLLSKASDLGVSPVNSVPAVLSGIIGNLLYLEADIFSLPGEGVMQAVVSKIPVSEGGE